MTATADAVVADRIEKRFGATEALAGVSFRVAPGEIFGFVGPDGGGKTTLFRILATLMLPDGGQARVLGLDVVRDLWALRSRIGYMPGRFSLYPDLSVRENLGFFASVFGTTIARERSRIAPIYSQLEAFADRRAGALSGGMKQKLALCCALVHRPEILFLDEPTTGVDAVSRREFWDLLGTLKQEGLTIVVSTPYMDEATRCDRVALIQRGGLLAIDAPQTIAASFDRPLFAVHVDDRYRALRALRESPRTRAAYPFGDSIRYVDTDTTASADSIAADVRMFLSAHGFPDARVDIATPTVEDVFIARMGTPEGAPAS
jgi:ABC-type multidrug transport system ATPase subunit